MADVFISYARADEAFAERLAGALTAIGLEVWWDRRLGSGAEWDLEIERQLDAAKAIVVIWSEASIESASVREEAHEARDQGKLAPIKIDRCRPPLFFRRHQFEDFSGWTGAVSDLPFQRLAIQLAAYSKGQDAAASLPFDGSTAPALATLTETASDAGGGLTRLVNLALMLGVIAGAGAYLADLDATQLIGPYWATALVLAGAAIGLFRAAEGALPAGPKALVARWLSGERTLTASQAFLAMFEAVFTERHFSLRCFWRSMLATLLVYAALLLVFIDLPAFAERMVALERFDFGFEGEDWRLKAELERNAVLLILVVPVVNILTDYVSLWQTRKILQACAGALPIWMGVLLDAALTALIFVLLLPLGPMLLVVAGEGFSAAAWNEAARTAWEVWRAFWAIFEGHPIAEIDAVLTREASLSTTSLLIAFVTTFITSVWLWFALFFAPLFRILAWRRGHVASLFGRLLNAQARPIAALGYGAAALIIVGATAAQALNDAVATQVVRDPEPFQDCDDCPWMVEIPGGEFMMGSLESEEGLYYKAEGPQRRVTIPAFAIGVYEITFREWAACARDGYCRSNPEPGDSGWGRGPRPVINVSWNDVVGPGGFLDWLNSKVPGEAPYRLPSEAEWEYAARAGTETRYTVGDEISHSEANFDNGVSDFVGTDRGQTLPVGAFAPNAYGLYDVHGNVREWAEDCWHSNYQGAPTDGSSWMAASDGDCFLAVLRGGSWGGSPGTLRSASRSRDVRGLRVSYIGFRVARVSRTLGNP